MGTVPLQGGQRGRGLAGDQEEHCHVSFSVEDTTVYITHSCKAGLAPFPIILQMRTGSLCKAHSWKRGHETPVEDDGLEKDTQQSRKDA